MGLITRLAVLAIAVLAFSPPGSLDAAANTGDVITFCKAFIPACGEVCVQYYPKDQPVVAKCQPAFMQTWKASESLRLLFEVLRATELIHSGL